MRKRRCNSVHYKSTPDSLKREEDKAVAVAIVVAAVVAVAAVVVNEGSVSRVTGYIFKRSNLARSKIMAGSNPSTYQFL